MEAFNTLLSAYYSTGSRQEVKNFLYQNAIHGIEFAKQHQRGQRDMER